MIGWMQKNNKLLVPTMWIAAIAFIGAGAVNWGSVKLGSSANSVAKVGDIDIPNYKFNFNYNILYRKYQNRLGNKFDRNKANKLGLGRIVLNNLINEGLLLNFAKDEGIIVTDKEVGDEIAKSGRFNNPDGTFNKQAYEAFVRNMGMKIKDFEKIVKDELTIRKLVKLIDIKPLPFEKEAISSAFNVSDKIKYSVINSKDINVTLNEDDIKKFWEKNKDKYLTKTKYNLELLWTKGNDVNITDSEIKKYYLENNFNYADANGKIKELKDVRDQVINDLKLSKIKKSALIERSKFKKGKIKANESVVLTLGDKKFNDDIWKSIKEAKEGEYLKPKALKDSFVTIHIKSIQKPKIMSYEEAKEYAKADLEKTIKSNKLEELANNMLDKNSSLELESKDYISSYKFTVLPKLTPQDSIKVRRSIFSNLKSSGKVNIDGGVVVYKIIDQKISENNNTISDKELSAIKSNELTSNLITNLKSKYGVELYRKDIK